MKKINDPVFGLIELDGVNCEGKYLLKGLKKKIDLYIFADENLDDSYRRTFEDFINNYGELKLKLQSKIFDYYHGYACEDARDDYSDLDEDELDEIAPILTKEKDINKLIKMKAIIVNDNNTIGLLYDCIWEEEHSLGIKLVNLQVRRIGFGDEAFRSFDDND